MTSSGNFRHLRWSISRPQVLLKTGCVDLLWWLTDSPYQIDASSLQQNQAKCPDRQSCRLYDAPHEFNLEMQADAWTWLRKWI